MRAVLAALVVVVGTLMVAAPAQAQVQRSFINLGFEDPLSTYGTRCVAQFDEAAIPGWTTNHPVQLAGFNSCTPVLGPSPGRIIELWHLGGAGFAGGPVTSRAGTTHAELNAEQASRLYQNVCLVNGEAVAWRLSHRSRYGTTATAYDVMQFAIDTSVVATLSSSTLSTFAPPVSGVFGGTATGAPAPNGWTDYTGSFVYTGPTGIRQFGFEAISAQGGVTQGNFVDEIQITLLPYVEFGPATSITTPEGGSLTVPSLKVSGAVPAGGITVPVAVSGTATSGSDYTPFALTYFIPAGTYYDTSVAPSIASVSSIQDTVIENNETVVMTLTPGAGYVITSTTTCGVNPPNNTFTWTIIDNDVDLRTTKVASTTTPLFGTPFTYTVTYQNNTGSTILAPTTSHGVTAAISDAVPAGLTFTSWTCQAGNGATCPGGTVNGSTSGSGAIGGNAVLPAGSAAAGGLLTYTITAALVTPTCSTITNASTITTPSGFTEGTSVQAGFTSPASGGTANNTASVDVTPSCAAVQLSKIWAGATAGEAVDLQISGPAVASLVNGSSTAPATTMAATARATPGSVVTLAESFVVPANAGGYITTLACTRVSDGTAVAVSGSGLSRTITMPVGSGVNCTYANTKQGSITIIKDAVPNDAQDFAFTTTGTGLSGFSLDDDADGALPNTRTFGNLTPGTYGVTETALAGWDLSNLVCADPDTGSVVNVAARAATIDLDAGETITCTYTNTRRQTDLQVVKTASANTVVSGDVITYTLVVSNNGPNAVTNAVLRDVPSTGQTCTAPSTTATCTATGGASCPSATVPVTTLLGAGMTIPVLPVGGRVTVTLQCTINATGQ